MVHESVIGAIGHTPLVYLRRLFPQSELEVIAKLEFLNPGGSVKDRPARYIVQRGLQDGTISSNTHLIESSSGNLGIALAMVSQVYGLPFTCVVDPKTTRTNLQILRQFGARIEMVDEPDDDGGYLKTRIRRVHELLVDVPDGLWINQYANRLNWQAHYYDTGSEIVAELDKPVDCLVAAVSTTGTIMGLARRLRQDSPNLRVIAVDAVGSVIFGTPSQPREIPGIGASRVPELLNRDEVDQVVSVSDWEAVEGCRSLVQCEGILAGGSSGSVVAAIRKLQSTFPPRYRVLTIFPDRGDRYLDMVYDNDWVQQIGEAEHLRMPTRRRSVLT